MPALLLGLHALLSLNAAQRLSPTWDEIVYPAAGVAQWHTRSIDLNREHGFLSKLIYALPVLALNPTIPFSDPSWAAKDAHRFGFQFTFHNRVDAQRIVFWGRVPAVLFSILTAALLFIWTRSVWGFSGGMISLAAYGATPILLSRASLALLEMPMYFFALLSLWLHDRWVRYAQLSTLYGSGMCMGLAFLCKLPALPLLPALLVLEWLAHPVRPTPARWLKNVFGLVASAAITIVVLYAPWKGSWTAFLGVVNNLFVFDTFVPYFWHGTTYAQAPVFFSAISFVMKAPLIVLALGFSGAWVGRRMDPRERSAFLHFSIFSVCCFSSILFFRHAVTTIQFSPAYLGLAGLAAPLGAYFDSQRPLLKYMWGLAVTVLMLKVLAVHPHYLAYFNEFVGGPSQGYRWLSDSDQDWGQDLPTLGRWMKTNRIPKILLSYSGAGDPEAYGIQYQDVFSPALVTRYKHGETLTLWEGPVWMVISAKVLHSEPGAFDWVLKNRTPTRQFGYTLLGYDITHDREAFQWLSWFYRQTGRNKLSDMMAADLPTR